MRKSAERGRNSSQVSSTSTTEKSHALASCNLDNFDCPLCNNSGIVWWRDPDDFLTIHSRDCTCMPQRIAIRKMKNSGLSDAFRSFTFDSFKEETPEYRTLKRKAESFVRNEARCFFLYGRPGSGKSHLCTAICSELIKEGYETKYFLWRKDIAELKSLQGEPSFKKEMNKLKNVPVLYIDDFFKGTVSEADSNLAFTIINDRYLADGKKTIISTELDPVKILSIDEAVGSRVMEMAKGYVLESPNVNWRLK